MADPVSNDVLAERIGNLQGDLIEIKVAVNQMSETMQKLVSVETRQADQKLALEKHEARISKIEQRMPGLIEMRVWFVGGMVFIAGAVVWAAVSGHIH